MSQELIEKTFRVPAPARLSLSNIRGSIEIQPGDDDIVNVTAVKHLGTGNPDRTEIEIRQEEDGSVSVETRFPEAGFKLFGWRQPCKVDYTVRVPHACSVKRSGVSCTAAARKSASAACRAISGWCPRKVPFRWKKPLHPARLRPKTTSRSSKEFLSVSFRWRMGWQR